MAVRTMENDGGGLEKSVQNNDLNDGVQGMKCDESFYKKERHLMLCRHIACMIVLKCCVQGLPRQDVIGSWLKR